MSVTFRDKTTSFGPSCYQVWDFGDQDLCIVRLLSPMFEMVKDISNHYIDAKDLEKLPGSRLGFVVNFNDPKRMAQVRVSRSTPTFHNGTMTYPVQEGSSKKFSNERTVLTDITTFDGECGFTYVAFNSAITHKIVGHHIAGGDVACIALVTRQDLDSIFKAMGEDKPHVEVVAQADIGTMWEGRLLPKEESKIPLDAFECDNVQVLGCVPPSLTMSQPSRSKIIRSPLHNMWHKSEYLPAMLGKDRESGVSPWHVGLKKKLNRPKNTHDDPMLGPICEYIVDKLPHPPGVEARKLTVKEALNGVPDWKYTKPVDLTTSAGWPYNTPSHNKPGKLGGKKDYVTIIGEGLEREIRLIPEMERLLNENTAKHERGDRVYTIISDQLKDEKLKKEKVRTDGSWKWDQASQQEIWIPGQWIGNTRIVGSQPIPGYVEEKQCLGALLEAVMQDHIFDNSFSDLGVDPSTVGDFTAIFRKMCRRRHNMWQDINVIAGDLKKMDASIPKRLSEAFRWIIIEWYRRGGCVDEKFLKQLETLDLDLSNPVHIAMNIVYMTEGNPSGRFATTLKNTIVMLMLMMLTAVNTYLRKHPEATDFNNVFEYVWETYRGLGDDHVHSVEDDCWYNMLDVRDECAKWGMEYTGIYKDKELVPYYKLSEVKYLQRTFEVVNGQVHGCLDKAIIEETPYWINTTLSEEAGLRAVVNSSLDECFHWGRDYFNYWKNKWNFELKQLRYEPIARTFEERQHHFDGTRTIHAQFKVHCQMEIKKEVDDADNTVVQTTTFADNSGIQNPSEEISSAKMPADFGFDPYPDQGLAPVLSRPYPVATLTWLSTHTVGQNTLSLDFPALLLAIPNIFEKLKRFQFLSAGVRISFRINATAWHQGKLLIAWTPNYNYGTAGGFTQCDNIFQNIYRASGLNHSILSANTTSTVDFIIPYVAPYPLMDLKLTAIQQSGWFGRVKVFVLHPLRLTGATAAFSVPITVYANFVDPKVAGLGLRLLAPPSGVLKKEKKDKKKLEITERPVMQLDESILEWSKLEIDPKKDRGFNIHGQMKKEAVARSDKSSLVGATAKKPTVWQRIVNMFLSPLESLSSSISGNMGNMVMAAILNKPTSVQAPQKVRIQSVTSFALGEGLDGAEKLAMSPTNAVSNSTDLFTSEIDYTNFDQWKLVPALFVIGNFTTSAVAGTQFLFFPVSPVLVATTDVLTNRFFWMTPLAHQCSFFRFWGGGIKFLVKFTASTVTTCRVRITWLPDPSYATTWAANEEGDTINMVVDITSDVEVEFTIPYLCQSYWSPVLSPNAAQTRPSTDSSGFNGQLVFTVVNPIVNATDAATGTIDYAIWIAGAEDFRVARPCPLWAGYADGNIISESDINVHAQMATGGKDITVTTDMRAAFRKPFQTIIPAHSYTPIGMHMGEEVNSWLTLGKRYHYYTTHTAVNFTSSPLNVTPGGVGLWDRIIRSFLLIRGSYRYKVLCNSASNVTSFLMLSNTSDSDPTPTAANTPECGITVISSVESRTVEAEIPFYSKGTFVNNSYNFFNVELPKIYGSIININGAGTPIWFEYTSFGDDFSMGWCMGGLPLVFTIPADEESE